MRTIVVTGGTGFIGRHVLRDLGANGNCNLVVLTRSTIASSQNVSYWQGQIEDAGLLEEIVEGADVVVHLAGCKNSPGRFHSTNVVGTRNVLSACEKANTARLIYLSSVGVVGPTSAEEVSETTPCRPANEYERSKYEAEVLVRRFSARRPGTTTILRPTNVFGEDDPERHLLNLITKIKARRFFFVGHDISSYYVNYVYVREISALVATLVASTYPSDLYTVNTPTRLGVFIDTIQRLLNDDRRIGHLTYWPVKAAALCGDVLPRSWVLKPPITSLKLAELTSRRRYSAALLIRDADWRPAFTMEEALVNLMAHYRAAGLLA